MAKFSTFSTLCLISLMLYSCGVEPLGRLGYQPPIIPVKISINQSGKISLTSSYSFNTPIGTFDISGGASIAQIIDDTSIPTLQIHINDEVTIYELDPNVEFEAEFDENQLYKMRELKHKRNGDIILILETVDIAQNVIIVDTEVVEATVVQRVTVVVTPKAQGSNPNTTNTNNRQILSPAKISCNGAPKTRLNVGYTARVTFTDGTANSIRFAPASRNYYGKAPEGTRMTILDGPKCDNKRVWWKVRTENNLTGWTAEGKPGDYWLEPID